MNHMPASVPQIDSGTVTAAASVGTSRRMNTSTTSSTSAMVISMVYCTSSTLARIVVVRSEMTVSWMSGGSHAISCGSSALDAVDGLDDVGAGRLGDGQQDRRLLAVPGGEARVGDAVDHGGDVGQPQHRAVAGLAAPAARSPSACEIWPLTPIVSARSGALEAAGRLQHIGAADGVVDVLPGQPGGGQAHRIEPHAHRGLLGAVDGDLRHAFRLRQALRQDGVGGVVDLRGATACRTTARAS